MLYEVITEKKKACAYKFHDISIIVSKFIKRKDHEYKREIR